MRYIDADALMKKIFPYDVVDKKCYTINAKTIYEAIQKAPTADVVPNSEVERLEVELEAMRGAANSYKMHYENAKSEVAREICCKVEEEIVAALESNYKAKSERLKNPHIDTADEFISWCEGKIAALRGIEDFVEELKKKYTEEKKDGNEN